MMIFQELEIVSNDFKEYSFHMSFIRFWRKLILTVRFHFSLVEKYRSLVKSIVQDGKLYGNSSLRKILQVSHVRGKPWLLKSTVIVFSSISDGVTWVKVQSVIKPSGQSTRSLPRLS